LQFTHLSNAVDLLVDLCTVMVTLLTSAGHGEGHTGGMPGSNTGHLAQTFVGLPWQLLGAPTGGHTLHTLSLGHGNHINHLILGEHVLHWHLLFQLLTGPVHLLGDVATIHLHFLDVRLLLPLLQKLHLGVADDADHRAVLLHPLQILLDLLLALVIAPLLGGLGESLLLGLVPDNKRRLSSQVLLKTACALCGAQLSQHSNCERKVQHTH
jgi:hypothetical protein